MEENWTVELIVELFQILEEFGDTGSLWVGVANSKPTFSFNCNDEFFWACSDEEEILPTDLPILRKAFEDLRATGTNRYSIFGADLFVCRKRGMRPQGACYPESVPEMWPLLDACGPEREVGLGNPYRPGERKKTKR